MPKHRLIATLLVDSGNVVQTRQFKRTNMVGSAFTAVDFFNSWTVDEIIVLEISDSRDWLPRMGEIVAELSKRCFVPLAVGGKIDSVELAARYLRTGADKVVVNTGAVARPSLITDIANRYGQQCVVVSIDAMADATMPSGYGVVVDNGRQPAGLDLLDWVDTATKHGAGELMINAITHDGNKGGYDLALLKRVTDVARVPVIAMGGAHEMHHFVEGVTTGGADAVAAGNVFHYFEHSTKKAKEAMAAAGVPVRSIGFYKIDMPRRRKYRPY